MDTNEAIMTTDTYTSRKGNKRVRIRVRPVGTNFGWVGELVAANGKIIDETDTCAFAASAHTAALGLTR
jgi:uncharacterized protein YegP (UPF0339 family)